MTLQAAMKNVDETFKDKQNPDTVEFTKLWDERGVLKGWWVTCEWEDQLIISLDMTRHYNRVIGNMDRVPEFTPGKHIRV